MKWGFRRFLISRGRHYIHIIKIKVIVFAACRKIIPQDRLLNDQQLGQPLSCLQEELQKSQMFSDRDPASPDDQSLLILFDYAE